MRPGRRLPRVEGKCPPYVSIGPSRGGIREFRETCLFPVTRGNCNSCTALAIR